MLSKRLFDFAWVKNFDYSLEELKNLAMPEEWDYKINPTGKLPILYNYVLHTFSKISEEGKIEYIDDFCIFNIGLVTLNQEEIFGYFQKNKNPGGKNEWFLLGWRKKSDRSLGRFSNLPEPANYFNNASDLIYDNNMELRSNIDHIVDDNLERFPESIKSMDKQILVNLLSGTIEDAKRRVKRNYKTAIPQYYNGKIQLLLPLCLLSKANADLALAVEKQDNTYRASTCLTLDMAVNNARLIAKPDDEWLKP